MNADYKTIIVIALVCIATVAVGYGIYTPINQNESPESYIFIPLNNECERGDMIFVGSPFNGTDEDGNRVRCWLYESKDVAWNRTNYKVDATQLPDYELPE